MCKIIHLKSHFFYSFLFHGVMTGVEEKTSILVF